MRVLVTGSGGFIGRNLIAAVPDSWVVRAASRTRCEHWPAAVEWQPVSDLVVSEYPSEMMQGVDVVVHLAGVAHRRRPPATGIRTVNVQRTEELATAASRAGVRKFIFVSSIAVHGPWSDLPVHEASPLRPINEYGRAKVQTEAALRRIASTGAMDLVIVRPPLVYGPDSPGNFHRLIGLVDRGIPLPLASADQRRALISIENLVSFLLRCLEEPADLRDTFVVRDDEELAMVDLLRLISEGLGRPLDLISVPRWLMNALSGLAFAPTAVTSLVRPLQIDDRRARSRLGWSPPVAAHQAILDTVACFRRHR